MCSGMLWLLFLTLPCLGSTNLVTPDLSSGQGLAGIVGGCPVSFRRFPWQVSLRFYNMEKSKWEHICGGSLIHPQWVLTAAHCVMPKELDACGFRVQVGQLRLYENDRLIKVAKIIHHPKFSERLSVRGGADIALLKLDTPAVLSERVYPVFLPTASQRVSSRKICWVAGWGHIEDQMPLPPPYYLREVAVPIVENSDCEQKYRTNSSLDSRTRIIKEDMLCAGREGHNSCQNQASGHRGGHRTQQGRWPWQVSLRTYSYKTGSWVHICGGSIIHPRWILTAAHCFLSQEADPALYRVQAGEIYLYKDQTLLNTSSIIIHPDFNVSTKRFDLALLKLTDLLVISKDVQPVSLPGDNVTFNSTDQCWLAGWGRFLDYVPLQPPYQLYEVKIPIRDDKTCRRAYREQKRRDKTRIIFEDMLCAGTLGRGPCIGDSGGPLVCWKSERWLQVGVVSWGRDCSSRLPAVFSRVQSSLAWIRQQIE